MGANAGTQPPVGELKTIKTDEIEKNPHNPRILFDPKPMGILKKSIEEVGILNPILGYRKEKVDPNRPNVKYVILDGERRWLCAREIEKERRARNEERIEVTIPARVPVNCR